MSFIDLPGYAEALKDDFRVLEEADNGMGDTVGLIIDYLEDELESHAFDMGLEENYRDRKHEVLVSPDEEVAVLYGEFYRESKIALLGPMSGCVRKRTVPITGDRLPVKKNTGHPRMEDMYTSMRAASGHMIHF